MNQCNEEIFAENLLPSAETATKAKRHIKLRLKSICTLLCALLAASVLCLCAAEKIDGAMQQGFVKVISELMLSNKSSINSSVFGSPFINEVPQAVSDTLLTLPRIYYIPRESIVNNSVNEEKKLRQMMFELYAFDYSKVPSGYYPIIPTDLSVTDPLMLKNDTTYEIDMGEIAKAAALREKESITKEPLVLIIHTHGTEGFSKSGTPYYNDGYNVPRSEKPSENAVAVGKVLAEELNKKGIPAVQCETMHDKDSYISAYEKSAKSIKHYLEKYPSIKYVFDVHRDSLIQSDLTKLRPVTIYNGEACAQIMMIVGSGEKSGIDYPFEDNLALATAIQNVLFEDAIGSARQIYLRGATYNQQYSRYGLLLEIGSCGNTLEEAKNAAKAFADAFEKVIK